MIRLRRRGGTAAPGLDRAAVEAAVTALPAVVGDIVVLAHGLGSTVTSTFRRGNDRHVRLTDGLSIVLIGAGDDPVPIGSRLGGLRNHDIAHEVVFVHQYRSYRVYCDALTVDG